MYKRKSIVYIVIFVLIIVVSGQLYSDGQWDLSLNAPYIIFEPGSYSEFLYDENFFIAVPDIKWNYFLEIESFKVGAGVRFWSLIIANLAYPIVSVESVLGNVVLNANIGGGVFLGNAFDFESSPITEFNTAPLVIPDVSIIYRIGKKQIFSIGTGFTGMLGFSNDVSNSFVSMPQSYFVGTILTRWTF